MGANDFEETDKGEHEILSKIVKKNCLKFHPNPPLPEIPYFLKTQSVSSSILSSTLTQSAFDVKDFSNRAAKLVLKYKYLEEEHHMIKASHLQESLDIDKARASVHNMHNNNTCAYIKLVKSQSNKGPISLKLNYSGRETVMDEGESIDIVLGMNDNIPVEFLLDDGDNMLLIESEKISIQKIISGIAYMGAALNPELKGELHKKGIDYEVKIDIRVKLSVKDRQAILGKRNNEVEELLNESNQNIAVFYSLMENLLINFNQDQGEFESLLRKRDQDRDGCCEKCLVI